MLRLKFILALLVFIVSPALASTAVKEHLSDAKIVGKGRLSIVFWDVYDATLYAPNGTWNTEKPYALSIDYFREIEGKDIAERSAEEIRKQGFSDEKKLSDWQAQMQAIFPQVKNGSNITAIFTAKKTTEFYFNGQKIGVIKDAEFSQYFFAIWLGEKTSEPKLRKELLGQS